jgi:predicted enzyme related to lactoylglutathione lyase
MATVSYWAKDVEAAKRWYTELLGTAPYFVRPEQGPPQYVEFRIGDQQAELGLIDARFAPKGAATGKGPGGAVLYWHVDDVKATFEKLLALGASEYEPITPREEGFVTASVVDPFGNVLGIMYNPHYLKVLGGGKD